MTHSFEVEIAQKYGLNAAIVLNLLRVWIAHNTANKKNLKEGRTWTYNSTKAWSEQLPYLTEKQVRSAIDVLVAAGLVVKANFNENTYDRTLWYSVTAESSAICLGGQMESPSGENGTAPEGKSVIQSDKPLDEPNDPSILVLEEQSKKFVDAFLALLIRTDAKITAPTPSARESWALAYRRLIQIDGKTKEEIWAVCVWGRNDTFWKRNFLSPCKLRDKKDGVSYFDRLQVQMKTPYATSQKSNSRSLGTNSNLTEFERYEREQMATPA